MVGVVGIVCAEHIGHSSFSRLWRATVKHRHRAHPQLHTDNTHTNTRPRTQPQAHRDHQRGCQRQTETAAIATYWARMLNRTRSLLNMPVSIVLKPEHPFIHILTTSYTHRPLLSAIFLVEMIDKRNIHL